jgi:8-amino-7-oxononanoate synthase
MDIFEKFRPLAETRNALARLGGEFFTIVIEDITSPTEAVINGRPTLLAGTNNYLGLTFDPDCIRAACLAAEREGTGTTGSRLANGTFAGLLQLPPHHRLLHRLPGQPGHPVHGGRPGRGDPARR